MVKKGQEKTETEKAGKRQVEEHPHLHVVRYKNKGGQFITYQYNYGKISKFRATLRKVSKR